MRKFIIGDIHGCYDELLELLDKVDLQADDWLISVGDIVDRGNQSQKVYEFFRDRPRSIVLMGNHERKHQRKLLNYAQEIVKVQMGDKYEEFLRWLDTLPYHYETEEAIVVHAAFEHDKPLCSQREDVLCGSTAGEKYLQNKYMPETYWTAYYTGNKPIIYGHHVVGDTPKIYNNTYGIDTGACHGHFLTAIELPSLAIHQVKAKKDYWKDEQRLWQIPVLKAKAWGEMSFVEIDKELDKLAYITEPATRQYLDELHKWQRNLLSSFDALKEDIDKLTQQLLQTHKEDFSVIAQQFIFKVYIFKSKTATLSKEDLMRGLNTPNKLMVVLQQLKELQTDK